MTMADTGQTLKTTEPVPLTQLSRGQQGRVHCCELDGRCAEMIESLGMDEDALISICRQSDPCIVRIHHRCGGSCRIGMRRELGHRIMVRPTTA